MLRSVCRAYGVEILYVFGSRTNEIRSAVFSGCPVDQRTAADVDLAIKIEHRRQLSVRQKAELAIELEDLLDVGCVDLVLVTDADPFLAVNIIRGARLFCEDDYLADEYELYILRRAGDLAPFERQRMKIIMDHQLSAEKESR